jgi:hypothetical protein
MVTPRIAYANGVIPALVAGIQPAACSCVRGSLGPGHKARDDTLWALQWRRLA